MFLQPLDQSIDQDLVKKLTKLRGNAINYQPTKVNTGNTTNKESSSMKESKSNNIVETNTIKSPTSNIAIQNNNSKNPRETLKSNKSFANIFSRKTLTNKSISEQTTNFSRKIQNVAKSFVEQLTNRKNDPRANNNGSRQ